MAQSEIEQTKSELGASSQDFWPLKSPQDKLARRHNYPTCGVKPLRYPKGSAFGEDELLTILIVFRLPG
jgi:hypothetical protein